MLDYKGMYESLKEEFETYQNFAEKNIDILHKKMTKLEKNLDALVNIVEVSKYINTYLSDDNLLPMINDMIIGILGVNYSSIYLKDGNNLVSKASNKRQNLYGAFPQEYFFQFQNGEPFIINCEEPIFIGSHSGEDVHSLIGVPVHLRERFIGYIIVEHTLFDFFSYDHIKFISSIANQIGIAIENNILYNKVRENSIRDPLLGIYNRKYFFEFVNKEIDKNPRQTLAIVMMDIDDFKKTNDIYGHQMGDEVLVQTVKLIEDCIGCDGLVARYGGEEIVLLIKMNSDFLSVYEKIDAIRKNIEHNTIRLGDLKTCITASFGISYYNGDGEKLEKVLNKADNLLYKAKQSGKNKVLQLC